MTDLPLFDWTERNPPKRGSRPFRRVAVILAPGLLITAVLVTLTVNPAPRFVWNVSASAPTGLYRVRPGAAVAAGDMVIARVPEAWRMFAARRGYIPVNVPLVKRVAAEPGDRVCAIGRTITVEDRIVAERLLSDARGRPMPHWQGCLTLRHGATLLLTTAPASFDGRYFGPSRREDVIGKAKLLWAR